MNKKPALVLAGVLLAGIASAFTASRVTTTFLYQPNGTTSYATYTTEITCPEVDRPGCITFINAQQGLKQLYTTFNNRTVPVDFED